MDEGLSSKQIAQQLNLSPATVDSYMRDAISYFEVTNRRQAANKIREIGENSDPSRLRPQAPRLAVATEPDMLGTSYAPPPAEAGRGALREMPVHYRADSATPAPPMLEVLGGVRHAHSGFPILLKIATLTAALVIVLSAAEPLGRGFQSLANVILQLRHE